MQDGLEIQSLGNEGFLIASGGVRVYVDAFFRGIPMRAAGPVGSAGDVRAANAILVTHGHWDHFHAGEVAAAAQRSGAVVVGPADVTGPLRKAVPAGHLLCLAPAADKPQTSDLPGLRVTAFRTFHGGRHNSYLIELAGFRIFHDGDNEDTRPLDRTFLRGLDALLIGPWQGSGWPAFIRQIAPRHTFLMHLTDGELDEHEAGTFLPSICEDPPEGLIALRPGQSFLVEPPPGGAGRRDGAAPNP